MASAYTKERNFSIELFRCYRGLLTIPPYKVKPNSLKNSMRDAIGDKEGFDKADMKLKQRQQALNDFVAKTERTMRVDRTQVLGYNKGVAGRVTQSEKRAPSGETIICEKWAASGHNAVTQEQIDGIVTKKLADADLVVLPVYNGRTYINGKLY